MVALRTSLLLTLSMVCFLSAAHYVVSLGPLSSLLQKELFYPIAEALMLGFHLLILVM